MVEKIYSIIEKETGEVILDYVIKGDLLKDKKINKGILKDILDNKNIDKQSKIGYIYSYLFSKKEINKYYQIKIHQINKDINKFKRDKIEELNNLAFYLDKIETITSEYSYCIKDANGNPIHNWGQLFDAIGLTNINRQQKLKEFILKHKLIAINKVIVGRDEQVRFYLNPFLLKNSDCANDYLIDMFKSFIKANINVDGFVLDLLKLKYE